VLFVASLVAAMSGVAAAQLPLSEVEVRLVRKPTGGCVDPCVYNYTVIIRGDGNVLYDGVGLVEGQPRAITPDDVVSSTSSRAVL
jgi:hypothetical protein